MNRGEVNQARGFGKWNQRSVEKKEYTQFLFLFERGWIASGLNPAFGQNREGCGGDRRRDFVTNEKVEIK